MIIKLLKLYVCSLEPSTTNIPTAMRADIARSISVQHIDQLATQYLGLMSDKMDEIRHDKPHGLDVNREVLRWWVAN